MFQRLGGRHIFRATIQPTTEADLIGQDRGMGINVGNK